ncbi:hypothetical protein GIX45_26800 [Erwinia sp. CPCC 100877]|nr:hypothetical protein [Erwinia sp. CPCC 100877]
MEELLNEKLNNYFNGDLSQQELGEWANQQYYDMLTGKYVIVAKLIMYKFIKIIAGLNTQKNEVKDEYPSTEKDIIEIKEILSGNKNYSFTGNIKINLNFCKPYLSTMDIDKISEAKSIISLYLSNKAITNQQKASLKMLFRYRNKKIVTLIDLLDEYSYGLINDLLSHQKSTIWDQGFGLFTSTNETSERSKYQRLLLLLNCMTGDASIQVFISFESGVGSISLLI